MKKVIIPAVLAIVVALSVLLVGCTTVKSISTDMGFTADDIAAFSIARNGADKSTDNANKIKPAFDLISEIQFDEFSGDVLESDKTAIPDYQIKIQLDGYAGTFNISVIVKLAGTAANLSDKDIALVWFAPTDDFNYKNVIEGFYSVEDSQALFSVMDKIYIDIMSFGA